MFLCYDIFTVGHIFFYSTGSRRQRLFDPYELQQREINFCHMKVNTETLTLSCDWSHKQTQIEHKFSLTRSKLLKCGQNRKSLVRKKKAKRRQVKLIKHHFLLITLKHQSLNRKMGSITSLLALYKDTKIYIFLEIHL